MPLRGNHSLFAYSYLLKEPIIAPDHAYRDITDEDVRTAAQAVIGGVDKPMLLRCGTERMRPLTDHDFLSPMPGVSNQSAVPDIGFATQTAQQVHMERSPWCGAESAYREREKGTLHSPTLRAWDGGAFGSSARSLPGHDGEWQWSGGGVGGSPIKKSAKLMMRWLK